MDHFQVKNRRKSRKKHKKVKHNVCMISDFFYPSTGGVESHIYQLSQCLIALGHKVIVITHSYGERTGVRYMTSGLKVYYLPMVVCYNGVILPTFFNTLPLMRNIFIRERITIVHGHSAFSAMANEGIMHARNMGIKTVFTDHSLFGFADASAIITNKLLQFTLADCNHVICVSHTGKGNTVLRAGVRPNLVSVIPNAVDTTVFTPNESMRDPNKITIVVISRLVYRKGIDLLTAVIVPICRKHSDVQFIIGGDGPKRIVLEELREKYQLHDRVQLLGAVEHCDVRDVLVQGNIFLNTSLTEAFCIAIVEAVSAGLTVVCTKVGGVPEVLPPDLMQLAEPNIQSLYDCLEVEIDKVRNKNVVSVQEAHDRIEKMYSWIDVAKRTENVYDQIVADIEHSFIDRLIKYCGCGMIFGKVFAFLTIVDCMFIRILEWIYPSKEIDIAPNYLNKRLKCL